MIHKSRVRFSCFLPRVLFTLNSVSAARHVLYIFVFSKVILRINHQVGHTNSLTYHLYCGRAGRGDKEEHCNGNSSKSKREGEREARLVI